MYRKNNNFHNITKSNYDLLICYQDSGTGPMARRKRRRGMMKGDMDNTFGSMAEDLYEEASKSKNGQANIYLLNESYIMNIINCYWHSIFL